MNWSENDCMNLWCVTMKDRTPSEELLNWLGLDSIKNVVQEKTTEVIWTLKTCMMKTG